MDPRGRARARAKFYKHHFFLYKTEKNEIDRKNRDRRHTCMGHRRFICLTFDTLSLVPTHLSGSFLSSDFFLLMDWLIKPEKWNKLSKCGGVISKASMKSSALTASFSSWSMSGPTDSFRVSPMNSGGFTEQPNEPQTDCDSDSDQNEGNDSNSLGI